MIFPPGAVPVAILLGGVPTTSYNHPYVIGGRIRAPIAPYVTRIADRIAAERGVLVASRGALTVRIRSAAVAEPADYGRAYVEVARIFRGLGATVHYDARRHVLDVQLPRQPAVGAQTPVQTAQPLAVPRKVFTPEPVVTPRPAYTGTPHPRRTPIVVSTSRPKEQ